MKIQTVYIDSAVWHKEMFISIQELKDFVSKDVNVPC